MELAALIYIISLLPAINGWLIAFSIGFIILTATSIFTYWIWRAESDFDPNKVEAKNPEDVTVSEKAKMAHSKKHLKWVKILAIAAVVSIIFNTLTPTEKTAWIMVGAYATQEIATTVYNNERARELGDKTLKIIEAKMDSVLAELVDAGSLGHRLGC